MTASWVESFHKYGLGGRRELQPSQPQLLDIELLHTELGIVRNTDNLFLIKEAVALDWELWGEGARALDCTLLEYSYCHAELREGQRVEIQLGRREEFKPTDK